MTYPVESFQLCPTYLVTKPQKIWLHCKQYFVRNSLVLFQEFCNIREFGRQLCQSQPRVFSSIPEIKLKEPL